MAEKTRKQLLKEPDEFITFTGRMVQFFRNYKASIIGAAAGLIIVFLAAAGVQYYLEHHENASFAELQRIIDKYDTHIKDNNDPVKAYQEINSDFEAFIGQYSGTGGERLGRMLFANICYKGNNPDKAIELYSVLLQDKKLDVSVKNFVFSGLAYAYEKKKDYPNAVHYFEMIVSGTESVLKSDALFNLGRLYEVSGQKDKSLTAYKQLVSDYPKSMYIELAKEKIAG